MNNRQLPGADLKFDDLPTDPKDRHEALIDLFGQYVMWMRKRAVDSSRELVQSETARERLGKVFRRVYEELSELSAKDQERSFDFAEATVDAFIQLLLGILAHRGVDFRLGSKHAIRYKLDVEICDLTSREPVIEEPINRNGQKHFADYWGRWINRFAVAAKSDSSGQKRGQKRGQA